MTITLTLTPGIRWTMLATALAATVVAAVSEPPGIAGPERTTAPAVTGATPAPDRAPPAAAAPGREAVAAPVPELNLAAVEARVALKFDAALSGNPFEPRSFRPPPPPPPRPRAPAAAVPPPPPQAPPLPFTWLGSLVDGESVTVFLADKDENFAGQPGEVLQGKYRIERIEDNRIVLTYLPLNQQQTLTKGVN